MSNSSSGFPTWNKMMLRLPSLLGSRTLAHFNHFTSILGQSLIVCAIHQSRVIATSKVVASGVVKEPYLQLKRCFLH